MSLYNRTFFGPTKNLEQAYILNFKKIKSVLHEILFYSRKTPNTKQPTDLLKFHSNFEVLN